MNIKDISEEYRLCIAILIAFFAVMGMAMVIGFFANFILSI